MSFFACSLKFRSLISVGLFFAALCVGACHFMCDELLNVLFEVQKSSQSRPVVSCTSARPPAEACSQARALQQHTPVAVLSVVFAIVLVTLFISASSSSSSSSAFTSSAAALTSSSSSAALTSSSSSATAIVVVVVLVTFFASSSAALAYSSSTALASYSSAAAAIVVVVVVTFFAFASSSSSLASPSSSSSFASSASSFASSSASSASSSVRDAFLVPPSVRPLGSGLVDRIGNARGHHALYETRAVAFFAFVLVLKVENEHVRKWAYSVFETLVLGERLLAYRLDVVAVEPVVEPVVVVVAVCDHAREPAQSDAVVDHLPRAAHAQMRVSRTYARTHTCIARVVSGSAFRA